MRLGKVGQVVRVRIYELCRSSTSPTSLKTNKLQLSYYRPRAPEDEHLSGRVGYHGKVLGSCACRGHHLPPDRNRKVKPLTNIGSRTSGTFLTVRCPILLSFSERLTACSSPRLGMTLWCFLGPEIQFQKTFANRVCHR